MSIQVEDFEVLRSVRITRSRSCSSPASRSGRALRYEPGGRPNRRFPLLRAAVALCIVWTAPLSLRAKAPEPQEPTLPPIQRCLNAAQERVKAGLRDLVRNGDFEAGPAAWVLSDPASAIMPDSSGSSALVVQLPAGGEQQSSILQEIFPPDELTQAQLAFRYSLTVEPKGRLQQFQALIATIDEAGQYQPAAILIRMMRSYHQGEDLQPISVSLGNDVLGQLSELRQSGKMFYLWFFIAGKGVTLRLDDIHLTVSGFRPGLPNAGALAFATEQDQETGNASIGCFSADGQQHVVLAEVGGQIDGLGWSGTGEAIAFASTHEAAISAWNADLYQVNKSGVTRLSNPRTPLPAVINKKTRKGTVTGRIRNGLAESGLFSVYVHGAPQPVELDLAPGTSTQFTMEVIDLGEGVIQHLLVRRDAMSWSAPNGVDVWPKTPVAFTEELLLDADGVVASAAQPCFREQSQTIWFIDAERRLAALHLDDQKVTPVLPSDPGLPFERLACSPSDERALLLSGKDGATSVWLLESDKSLTALVEGSAGALPQDPSWLPDGRGIVFVQKSCDQSGSFCGQDLYLFQLEEKQPIRLTQFHNESASRPSVSPDGRTVAFLRQLGTDGSGPAELWMLDLQRTVRMWPIRSNTKFLALQWSPLPSAPQ